MEGERDRERGYRAKPGIQLVIYIILCSLFVICNTKVSRARAGL